MATKQETDDMVKIVQAALMALIAAILIAAVYAKAVQLRRDYGPYTAEEAQAKAKACPNGATMEVNMDDKPPTWSVACLEERTK